jgi:hypothetical protein
MELKFQKLKIDQKLSPILSIFANRNFTEIAPIILIPKKLFGLNPTSFQKISGFILFDVGKTSANKTPMTQKHLLLY